MDEWALDEKSNCNESAIFFVIVQMLLITFITRKSICENETFLNINLRHYFCSPFSFRCHSSYSIRLALINTIAFVFANGTRGTCRCIIIPNSPFIIFVGWKQQWQQYISDESNEILFGYLFLIPLWIYIEEWIAEKWTLWVIILFTSSVGPLIEHKIKKKERRRAADSNTWDVSEVLRYPLFIFINEHYLFNLRWAIRRRRVLMSRMLFISRYFQSIFQFLIT